MKKLYIIFITNIICFIQVGYSQVAMLSKTGNGNWNVISNWKSKNNLTGTLTSSTGSSIITGNGTSFLTELSTGSVLYQTNGTTVIGTIASITNNTLLTLTGNASVNQTNQQFRLSKIPGAGDTVIIDDNNTIIVTANVTCASLELASGGNDADIRISSGITLTVTGAVTINPGTGSNDNREVAVQDGILNCASVVINDPGNDNRWCKLSVNNGTINVSGNITMYAPAGNSRNQIAFTNAGTLNVSGNIAAGGDILPASATSGLVNYNGTGADQTVKEDTYADLSFSGGAGKTLAGPVNVTDVTTFNNGKVFTTATNLLIINSAGSVTGASDLSFVNGPISKIGNTAFTFPVGKIGAGYHFCGISAAASSQTFKAEYMRASGSTLGPITAPGLKTVSNCEYWKIDRESGSANVDVTLSWNGNSNCNAAAYVTDLSSLTVAHFNGTSWDTHGKNSSTGNVSSGTITWNAVSVFSPFTLGSTSAAGNPLPVKFDRINANIKEQGVQLYWLMLTESDVDHYEIERSADNRQFNKVGEQIPILNNGEKAAYFWLDSYVENGIFYYRIKSVGRDKSFIYSSVVKIKFSRIVTGFTIYPNPVRADQKISYKAANMEKGNYNLRIYNSFGQLVSKTTLYHTGGPVNRELSIPLNSTPGKYTLQLEKEARFTSYYFIVN